MNTKDIKEAITELRTLRDVIRWGASCFNEAGLYFGHGFDNSWDEAVALVLHSLHLSHDLGDKIIDARLTTKERRAIIELFQTRVINRIPVSYLTHEAWFAGLPFYVDPHVLIPRSPIAELIEARFEPWVDPDQVERILDIGTGSGCIAIACAHYFPDVLVDAVDSESSALHVAKRNIEKHHLQDHVHLIESNLFNNVNEKYDIIVANPPYVDAGDMASLLPEYLHEPRKALAAGESGLDCVHTILTEAHRYLKDEGILIVEVGNSAEALEQKYPQVPFLWLEFERGGEGVFLLTKKQASIYVG